LRELVWLAGASLVSWLVVAAIGGSRVNPEVFFGMLAPLAGACASWVAVSRTQRAAPDRVVAVMTVGFALKLLGFGAYLAVMLRVVGLRPIPFVAAFVSYVIALYAMQAVFLRRLTTVGAPALEERGGGTRE
jgi:hypothetical protein